MSLSRFTENLRIDTAKTIAAKEFIQGVRFALSTLCQLATDEITRETLANLLRKIRTACDLGAPAHLAFARVAQPHIYKYSPRIVARDEDFLHTVDLRKECAEAGVELDSDDEPLAILFESFRKIYKLANKQTQDELYQLILCIHNSCISYMLADLS